jgi:hypothetical protein
MAQMKKRIHRKSKPKKAIVPRLIIGIDQTGAVDAKGRPKKLSIAVWEMEKQILHVGLSLPSLTYNSVLQLISSFDNNYKVMDCLVLVDSVLGLPSLCRTNIHQLLKRAGADNKKQMPYGAKPAYHFFQGFPEATKSPKRKIEITLKANSVFHLTPYQRNIGCGTYRILRDLAQDQSWFRIWSQELVEEERALVAEVYPSYFWKKHLKSNKRDFDVFEKWLKTQKIKTLPSPISKLNPDHTDAAVVAVLAAYYEMPILSQPMIHSPEGWIFGYENLDNDSQGST